MLTSASPEVKDVRPVPYTPSTNKIDSISMIGKTRRARSVRWLVRFCGQKISPFDSRSHYVTTTVRHLGAVRANWKISHNPSVQCIGVTDRWDCTKLPTRSRHRACYVVQERVQIDSVQRCAMREGANWVHLGSIREIQLG